MWTFKGYINDKGQNVIDAWYKSSGSAVQAKLDYIIKMFQPRMPHQWTTKFFKRYKGLDSIYEFRWEIDKKWYRILGAFKPNQMDFTFLIATEKEQKNIRPEEEDIAVKRLNEIVSNPDRAKECEFDAD